MSGPRFFPGRDPLGRQDLRFPTLEVLCLRIQPLHDKCNCSESVLGARKLSGSGCHRAAQNRTCAGLLRSKPPLPPGEFTLFGAQKCAFNVDQVRSRKCVQDGSRSHEPSPLPVK